MKYEKPEILIAEIAEGDVVTLSGVDIGPGNPVEDLTGSIGRNVTDISIQ